MFILKSYRPRVRRVRRPVNSWSYLQVELDRGISTASTFHPATQRGGHISTGDFQGVGPQGFQCANVFVKFLFHDLLLGLAASFMATAGTSSCSE